MQIVKMACKNILFCKGTVQEKGSSDDNDL